MVDFDNFFFMVKYFGLTITFGDRDIRICLLVLFIEEDGNSLQWMDRMGGTDGE